MMDYMREDQAEQLEFAVDDTNTMMTAMLARTGEANLVIRWFMDARKIVNEAILKKDPDLLKRASEQLAKIQEKLIDLRGRFTEIADQWLCDQALTAVKAYQSAYIDCMALMEK